MRPKILSRTSYNTPVVKKPLLLLDRDGTLIEERGYPSDPGQVRLLPGVPQALRKLKTLGFPLVVLSNQSGIGRGLVTPEQARQVNQRFLALLREHKASIDGLYLCPHRPEDHCACRKPALGMVRKAARELRVSWKHSISIGDRPSDVQVGQRTGGTGILVLTGYGRRYQNSKEMRPDHTAASFARAADWIIKQERNRS